MNFLDLDSEKTNILKKLKDTYSSEENNNFKYPENIDDIDEKDIENYYHKNPICTLKDTNDNEGIIEELQDKKEHLEGRRKIICNELGESLQKKEKNILEFMGNEYNKLYKLDANKYFSENLNRIIIIFKDKKSNEINKLSCKEIAEINNYLKVPTESNRKTISFISLLFELLFGFIITEEQWNIFNSIYDNFENKQTEKRIVTQFMMGKGKSSVITPLLILNILEKNKNIVNLVVPKHLVQQTKKGLEIYRILFNLDDEMLRIIDDSTAKHNLIKGEYTKNDIFLFDEFDMMFDPLQSNFNLIYEDSNSQMFFEEKDVVEIMKFITGGEEIDDKNDFVQEVKSILNNNLMYRIFIMV